MDASGNVVSEWAGEDRVFAYNLTSIMFTLVFWCACLFHYLVSAGRVDVDWPIGRVRAKGWIVMTSRRAHRVLLSVSLVVSAMTIIQSIVTSMVITHFYIGDDAPNVKEHIVLILLKIDQTLAFFMFVFVLGRIVFEPLYIRKLRVGRLTQRRHSTLATHEEVRDITKEQDKISDFEECSICVERLVNRRLNCGHCLCCCCLVEIWKAEGCSTPKCPFCRKSVAIIWELKVAVSGVVAVNYCCGENVNISESTDSPGSLGAVPSVDTV